MFKASSCDAATGPSKANSILQVAYNKMAPPVPDDVQLSPDAEDFRLKCFTEDPAERPTAEALKAHPWLTLLPDYSFPVFH